MLRPSSQPGSSLLIETWRKDAELPNSSQTGAWRLGCRGRWAADIVIVYLVSPKVVQRVEIVLPPPPCFSFTTLVRDVRLRGVVWLHALPPN